MRRLIALSLALALTAPGCSGCGEEPAEPATVEKAAAVSAEAAEPEAQVTPNAAPKEEAAPHPLAAGWRRAVPAEPHPEARGLYRRAIERIHAGAPDDAAPLFARLRADFAETRFAARLKGGGDPAATAALLGLAATVGAATFIGAARSLSRPRAAPPTP